MNRFVYITESMLVDKKYKIQQYEVGILKKSEGSTAIVQFVDCPKLVPVPTTMIKSFNPSETGDQFDYKVCNRCNRYLPIKSFMKNQNGVNNRSVRRPSCNDCRKLIDGTKLSSKDKNKWEKSKPNLEIWECPICKKRTIPGLTSKIVLDHNHKTGKPNAWICDSCNTGLGRFNDDTEVMEEAIKYLKEHQE